MYSNDDGFTAESTTVTVATTTSDMSIFGEVVKADSVEAGMAEISSGVSNTQQYAGTPDAILVQDLESTVHSPSVVDDQLNGYSQTIESAYQDGTSQLITDLQSITISQSSSNSQQNVFSQYNESGFPTSTTSHSFTSSKKSGLSPHGEPQHTCAQASNHPSGLDTQGADPSQPILQNSYQEGATPLGPHVNSSPQHTNVYQQFELKNGANPPRPTPDNSVQQANTHPQPQWPRAGAPSRPTLKPANPQHNAYQQLQPNDHYQASQNLQAGQSFQEPSNSLTSTYEQYMPYQNPQLSTSFEGPVYAQEIKYEPTMSYQDPQPIDSFQTLQTSQNPQSGPLENSIYSQDSPYQQPVVKQDSQNVFSQTSEMPPLDSFSICADIAQDPQAPDYLHAPEKSQILSDSSPSIQASSQAYIVSDEYEQTDQHTTLSEGSELPDNENNLFLATSLDQPGQIYQTSAQLDIGAMLGDDAAGEVDGSSRDFTAAMGEGVFTNASIDPTAVLSAGVGIANSAANALSAANPAPMISAGIRIANSTVNALSGDPVAALQAGVGVAMSGVRIAASIGTWNEARQRRKEAAAQFAAAHGDSNSAVNSQVVIAAQLDEALLVLSVLGQRLVLLGVVNLHELPQALEACRTACGQVDSGNLLGHFDTLDGTLQYTVTAAFFFCAACFPMHIYRGFGTGVLNNFLWGCPHPHYASGQTAGFKFVDRTIAFLKSMPREVQLIIRIPAGLSRIVPSYEKNEKTERRRLMSAYKEFIKEIETKGHPQPRDRSFRVVSWHIPFATWNSPFTFKNSGHYWEDVLRWQLDAGRLLHAWIIGGHLDLMHGEIMWLPSGVAESLARWLEGLPGTTFKLVPSSAFDYSNLRLSPATRRVMLEEGFETVKAVRDPQAGFRRPVIAQNTFVPAPPPLRARVPQQQYLGPPPSAVNSLTVHPQVPDREIGNPQVAHRSLASQTITPQSMAQGNMASNPPDHQGTPFQLAFSSKVTQQNSVPQSKTHQGTPFKQAFSSKSATPNIAPQSTVHQGTPFQQAFSLKTANHPPLSQTTSSNTTQRRISSMPIATPPHIPMQQGSAPPFEPTIYQPRNTLHIVHQDMATNQAAPLGLASNLSMPHAVHPNPYGQPIRQYVGPPQAALQNAQHHSMTQRLASSIQGTPCPEDQHHFQPPPSMNNSQLAPSIPLHSTNSPHASPMAMSQVPPLSQFPTTHPQRMPLTRKPTSASRLPPAENLVSTNPNRHSSHSSIPPTQLHSPDSSLSRTSTISSQHSSSSHSSAPPIRMLNSPINSPLSPGSIPESYQQPQYHFPPQQALKTVTRRVVPAPPPPAPLLPAALRQARAMHDFTPEQENELGFRIGDVLDVLDDSSQDGWLEARLRGRVGVVPGSYVQNI